MDSTKVFIELLGTAFAAGAPLLIRSQTGHPQEATAPIWVRHRLVGQDPDSVLDKMERPDGRLSLVWAHLHAGHIGAVDRTGRYYLLAGKKLATGSDGVFVRDLLQTGSERTLVPPLGGRYNSLPRFYGDTVIYIHDNALCQMELNGSNIVRLFPPPGIRLTNQGR